MMIVGRGFDPTQNKFTNIQRRTDIDQDITVVVRYMTRGKTGVQYFGAEEVINMSESDNKN